MKEDFPSLDDDIRKNKKLYLKIKKATIIAKEKLSAAGASSVSVTVDNVINDDDYEGVLDIQEINKIVEDHIIPVLENELRILFKGLPIEDTNEDNPIDIIILGGSNRIPRIQEYYKSLKQKEFGYFSSNLNQTVNMDENISCGCCYYSLVRNGIWKVNIECDIINECIEMSNNVKYINMHSTEESQQHFMDIDPSVYGEDEKSYYKVLLMNHKWLVDRNAKTRENDVKRNEFETYWYNYYCLLFIIL